MKKIFMMALMAATATTAFAQESLVKEAKSLFSSGKLDEAAAKLDLFRRTQLYAPCAHGGV